MPQYIVRRQSLDRFIRRPSNIILDILEEDRNSTPTKYSNDDSYYFKNTAIEIHNVENYRNELKEVFFPTQNRELSKNKRKNKFTSTNQWPVQARTKPLLPSMPHIILDMPDLLQREFWRNIIDWGSNNYIATVYNEELYFWNPDLKEGLTFSELPIKDCIKWNQAGTLLAISLGSADLAIFDYRLKKITLTAICPCSYPRGIQNCEFLSMEWSKSNNLLTACSSGLLSLWSTQFKVIKYRFNQSYQIIRIALSCNDNYVVTLGKNNKLKMWTYPNLQYIDQIKLSIPTKAVSFHPWKDALVVVGGNQMILLINIQTKCIITSIEYSNCIIDNLIFNPKSAELLLSVYDTETDVSYLRVLQNLNTVIDEVRCNDCRTPYLMWDSTGTKIGSASTDENLYIWNFFGNLTKTKKHLLMTKKREYSTNALKNLNPFANISTTIR